MSKTLRTLDQKVLEIRAAAEADLAVFIRLVHPMRVLGAVHEEVISWWNREEAKTHQLLLLPRDHGKSAMVAYRVAWAITKNPAIRILYLSSTANLATKQLKFIKDILTSPIYRRYWPEMINLEEAKREKWTENEISVDHPKRKSEAVRDPTVFTAGLTTTVTGMHCDVAVLDDVVVIENAYTAEGREKVKQQYSLLGSIGGAEAKEWVVGTRYHPVDLYNDLVEMNYETYSPDGEITGSEPLYEVFERQVEDVGDGSGQFLWPRQQRYDGKWFGFDQTILSRKRAQYLDKVQFRAQYYNDPNDSTTAPISRDAFQYYDPSYLRKHEGKWYFKGRRINIFASIDFAFSMAKKADFTALVVIGIDSDRNYYVLDIKRFKTSKISEYFQQILDMYKKWEFRTLRAEITSGQKVIVQDLKDNYIRPFGLSLSIDEFTPTRHLGNKEERVGALLQPRYANKQIWHYKGGNCQILEEELVLQNPPHDDVKDCLASAIDVAVPPTSGFLNVQREEVASHSRFGGIF